MKILAVASAGGHWIELLRLIPVFEENEVIFMSTKSDLRKSVEGYNYINIPDASRKNKLRLIRLFFVVLEKIYKIKPDVIITTGAAPGLLTLLAGKLIGAKTIWVDSIANVEKLSMSGRIALRFGDKVYTQWEDLATSRVYYSGSILS